MSPGKATSTATSPPFTSLANYCPNPDHGNNEDKAKVTTTIRPCNCCNHHHMIGSNNNDGDVAVVGLQHRGFISYKLLVYIVVYLIV